MPVIKPFEDFKLHKAADSAVIEKYEKILPEDLIKIWKEYGFGSFAKGFLRTINPDEYQELLNETYITKNNNPVFAPVPILTTALGDILTLRGTYEMDGIIYFDVDILFYRYGRDKNVSDAEDFFTEELIDINVYKNCFYWDSYLKAVKAHGTIPEYDECYGYVPLLGLGGSETVKNMQIVKLKEHIMLIKEAVGPVKYQCLDRMV